MNRHYIKAALGAVAFACAAGAAQASLITFDGPDLDTSGAAGAPYFLFDREVISQGYFNITTANVKNGSNAGDGTGTGALIDGIESQCAGNLVCPGRNSTYLATVDDGVVGLTSKAPSFKLTGFSAGFIGPEGRTNSQASGLSAGAIRLFVVLTDGSFGYLDSIFWLPGTDAAGATDFVDFTLSAAEQALEFVEVDFIGYGCSASGACTPFGTNTGQFGLDDINATEIPEPAGWLLAGTALAALGATTRRRSQPKA
ncbi:NF038120 family PEP-CTERM protein [Pelomonas sp. KK5]|uniref:NF038120 family PEP-CTERM protein n=1 Tax=Pelomonas sp. KK5 TaxID=1855730 RepID=UPI00097BC00E|nr:NF038120 family PEP-CTERM protein [Pelomonas sp. KK5]